MRRGCVLEAGRVLTDREERVFLVELEERRKEEYNVSSQ
jgi:hypothetical protein